MAKQELSELDKMLRKVSAKRRRVMKAVQNDPSEVSQKDFDEIADLEKEVHRLMSLIR